MIDVRRLTKRYGSTVAVDQLSFDGRPGTVTGFLGLNGSGKSTTMRLILGPDIPDDGSEQPRDNDDEVRAADPGDGFGDGVVGAVGADQHAELLECEPGDVLAGFDGGLAEGFEQERLAGA